MTRSRPEGSRLPRPPVAFLAGPTGVGKTEIGVGLAERHGWSIVSLDSRQIYRGLEIGTAKPTPRERERAAHHLIDRLDPGEACSAGRFRRLYLEALERLEREGRRALAVGGAGFYWEACTRGLHDLPQASAEIRREQERILRTEGVAGLYRRLLETDPRAAAGLEPTDRQRIGRALEINLLTGRTLHEVFSDAPPRPGPPAPVVVLLRDRRELARRIEERCRKMLDDGLLEEIRGLLDAGVSPDAPGFRTVGYREFLPHLLEGASLREATERFLRNSRRYAKRQETWFRNRVADRIEIRIPETERAERSVLRVEEAIRALGIDLDRDGGTP